MILLLETGIYDHGVLCLVSLCDLPDAFTLPYRNPHIFKDAAVDFGLKSIWRPDRTPLKSESGKVSGMDYQWLSSIFRGCFYQGMMQSPSFYRIFGRIPCYIASCNVVFHICPVPTAFQSVILTCHHALPVETYAFNPRPSPLKNALSKDVGGMEN